MGWLLLYAIFFLFLVPIPSLSFDYELIASYEIDILEASGLAYDPERDVFYAVSDEGGPIYVLSKKGEILGKIGHFEGDLEGIAYDPERDRFFIAEEQNREVILFERKTGQERRMKIDLLGFNRRENQGIEGVAFNPENGHLFVVKERSPHFVLELDADGRRVGSFTIEGAWDFSDISYGPRSGHLFILSRTSRKVYETTPSGKLIEPPFSFEAFGAEGLAIDREGNLYLVIDGNGFLPDRLLVFKRRVKGPGSGVNLLMSPTLQGSPGWAGAFP